MEKSKHASTCAICGKEYVVCKTCKDINMFSWKTVTDTSDCFKIFTVLHSCCVTGKITKEEAKKQLETECKLADLKEYPSHIKAQLEDILGITPSIKEEVKSVEETKSAKTDKK